MSRVRLISPAAEDSSPELQSVLDLNLIEWQAGSIYHLELGFDGEPLGQRLDFDAGKGYHSGLSKAATSWQELPYQSCWACSSSAKDPVGPKSGQG